MPDPQPRTVRLSPARSERTLPGLEPDEPLLALAPASFRGAMAASVRSTLAMSAARRRMEAYYAWQSHAASVGFDTDGPDMVVGLTDTTLVVWSTTFFLGRPGRIAGRVPLAKIADVAASRHGAVTGVALVFTGGHIVEIEAMRGRRLRRLADALQAAVTRPPG